MGVEVAILGGEKGLDDRPWDLADRHRDTMFALELGHQAAVAGVDLGAGCRQIIGKLVVIRELAPELRQSNPDEAADPDRGDDENDEGGARDPAQSPQHQRHTARAANPAGPVDGRGPADAGASDTAPLRPMVASASTTSTAAEAKWSRRFLAYDHGPGGRV